MSRRHISFFVHDLSNNPIVRAAPLAEALADDFDVEMLGFVHDGDIYAPYREAFEYRTLSCSRDVLDVLGSVSRLAALARGELIYACKPLATSLGPALIASRLGRGRPLLLDIEDDEWVPMGKSRAEFVYRDLLRGWRHAAAWKYTQLLHPLVRCAAGITVSSHCLQRRYGGVLVRHGPAEHTYDPARFPSRQDARAVFGLPSAPPLALFAGVPHPHKGLDVLRSALLDPLVQAWHLVLAGDPGHAEFAACATVLQGRCHRIGLVQHEQMPSLLASVDAVPVPQLAVPFAESQIPAKALEAMAMARAVVGTRVGDLPELLGEGKRGWLVPPSDSKALAAALAEIAEDAENARLRGTEARSWFLEHASRKAIKERLLPVIDRALQRRY